MKTEPRRRYFGRQAEEARRQADEARRQMWELSPRELAIIDELERRHNT